MGEPIINEDLTQPLKDDSAVNNLGSRKKTTETKFIYVLAVLSAIGGFLFGYDTGVVSGAMLLIRKEFLLDNIWHEAIVSGTIAAAWIFALTGGYISDRMGRKPVILMASVVFAIGSIVMGAANDKETLLIGRIIVGIGIGLASMGVPLYIAEAASASARGLLVTLNNIFITGGQAIAALVCGAFSSQSDGWRYMLGIAAVPALVQLIGFLAMPESPRWLMSRGRREEAERVLQRIRGPSQDVTDELEAIKASCEETERELTYRQQKGKSTSVLLQVFQNPAVRRALLLGCLLQIFQQISGINTVMYYSASIIQMAGFYDTSIAIWLAALTAAVNFLCTFIGLYLVERVGRRSLTLISLAGVVFSLAFLGFGFREVDMHTPPTEFSEWGIDDLCGSSSTCLECSERDNCGFCFTENEQLGRTQGFCLLVDENHTEIFSNYGPCSNATEMMNETTSLGPLGSKSSFVWAYGWCPSSYGWITVVGLMVYLFFFAPGMGPMPWTVNSEIYPLWARSTCNSIATSTNWFFNLMVSMTFLTMTEFLSREGTFFFYSVVAAIGFVIFWFIMPETRGRSLEEMEILFTRPWNCSSNCSRNSATQDTPDNPDSKTVHSDQHAIEDQL